MTLVAVLSAKNRGEEFCGTVFSFVFRLFGYVAVTVSLAVMVIVLL